MDKNSELCDLENDKNYLKIFKNKKYKKTLSYLLGHEVINRMTFVSMFWDQNLTYIYRLPFRAFFTPLNGGGSSILV